MEHREFSITPRGRHILSPVTLALALEANYHLRRKYIERVLEASARYWKEHRDSDKYPGQG